MSNGTSKLDYKDPGNFTTLKNISVTENGYPVENLNELEFAKEFIYDNICTNTYVFKIDLLTGKVIGKIDFSRLYAAEQHIRTQIDVLNGIAYNKKKRLVLCDQKAWELYMRSNYSSIFWENNRVSK